MADLLDKINVEKQTVNTRYKDMGDGTYAPVVYAVGSGSVGSSASAGLPSATSSTIVAVSVSGTVGTYTPFAALAATHLDIVNNTGVSLRVRKVGTTEYLLVADGQGYMVFPITNNDQVEVALDVGGTEVVVRATSYA